MEAKVLNLDEERLNVTVVFQDKKYVLKELDSKTIVYWGRKQRERARMQAHLTALEEKMSAPDIQDKQYETFEGNVQALENKLRDFSADLLSKVLEGMTVEVAGTMSLRQQGKVFRTLGEGMEAVTAAIAEEMETPEGEASQP